MVKLVNEVATIVHQASVHNINMHLRCTERIVSSGPVDVCEYACIVSAIVRLASVTESVTET